MLDGEGRFKYAPTERSGLMNSWISIWTLFKHSAGTNKTDVSCQKEEDLVR